MSILTHPPIKIWGPPEHVPMHMYDTAIENFMNDLYDIFFETRSLKMNSENEQLSIQ